MAKVYGEPAKGGHESHGGHADHAGEEHGSTGLYWLIGIILAIVTAVEVAWPLLGLSAYGLVGGLIALMVLKGAMVVMYFMHLKGDFSIFKFVFVAPFILAVAFVLAFIALFAGEHPGIAG